MSPTEILVVVGGLVVGYWVISRLIGAAGERSASSPGGTIDSQWIGRTGTKCSASVPRQRRRHQDRLREQDPGVRSRAPRRPRSRAPLDRLPQEPGAEPRLHLASTAPRGRRRAERGPGHGSADVRKSSISFKNHSSVYTPWCGPPPPPESPRGGALATRPPSNSTRRRRGPRHRRARARMAIELT